MSSSSATSLTSSARSRNTASLSLNQQHGVTPEASVADSPWSDADAGSISEHRKVFAEGEPYRRPYPRQNDAAHWQACYQAVEKHDNVACKDWKEDVDTLLVFAGLFSAVVTAFTIESYKWLEPDPADISARLLLRISEQLANGNITMGAFSQEFSPAPSDTRINVFWFLSLSIALVAALVGILCKQWLREFEKDAGLSYRDGLALRHMRFEAFQKWNVDGILSMLPLLLQLALLCFFVGLLDLLWDRNTTVAIVVTVFIGTAYALVLATTVLPTFLVILGKPYTHLCAFKSPQALVFLRFIDSLRQLRFIPTTTGTFIKRVDGTPEHSALNWIDLERVHLDNSYVTNECLVRAVGWVEDNFSQNPGMIPYLYHCVSELHSLSAQLPWVYRDDILGDVLYPARTLQSDGAASKDRALFAYLAQHKSQLDPVMKKHFIELFLRRIMATRFEGAAVEWASVLGIDWRLTKELAMMVKDVYWQLLEEGELTREVLCASVEPILSVCFGLLVESKSELRFAQMIIGFEEGTRFTHSVSLASSLIAMLHSTLQGIDAKSEADAHMIRGYVDACCSAMKIEERGDTRILRLVDWPKCRLLDVSEFDSYPEASALRELQALVMTVDDLRQKFVIELGKREHEWTGIVEKVQLYRKRRVSLISAANVVAVTA